MVDLSPRSLLVGPAERLAGLLQDEAAAAGGFGHRAGQPADLTAGSLGAGHDRRPGADREPAGGAGGLAHRADQRGPRPADGHERHRGHGPYGTGHRDDQPAQAGCGSPDHAGDPAHQVDSGARHKPDRTGHGSGHRSGGRPGSARPASPAR